MIDLFINKLYSIFSYGDKCYYCNKKMILEFSNILKPSFIDFSLKPIRTFVCPNGHVEYDYDIKTGKLITVIYNVGKYSLYSNYRRRKPVDSIQIVWKNNNSRSEKTLIVPYFDIEKLTHKQLLKKIKLYLVFS